MMYGNGFGWGLMMVMPLVWLALLAIIIWAAVRVASHGRPAGVSSAQEILDRRFASGEIDADAYAKARRLLSDSNRGSS